MCLVTPQFITVIKYWTYTA